MIEINPNKIKKAEIVIGIPSYNEADAISNVVRQVDKGLEKYFSNKSAVIINSDNNSSDKTKEVFLAVKTKAPKIYISTPKGIKGKGNNLKNLFLKIKKLKAKAGATVDADLKSISPEWISCLIGPILKGYDYLTPVYHRHKYDATITNNLCYPLIYGLLGYNIRQPIGGDMAFSNKMVNYWLKQKWPQPAKNFGIDIFMTLNAIKSRGRIGQVDLGAKVHKPSAPKLDNMFLEVADTFFWFLSENKNLWNKKIKIKKPVLVCQVKNKEKYPVLDFDYKKIEKKVFFEFKKNYKALKPFISKDICFCLEEMFLKEKSLKIDSKLWPEIVYQFLAVYQKNKKKREEVIKLLRALYFGRVVCFAKEVSSKNREQAEKIIQNQAHHFFKTRDYLFSQDIV